MWSNQESSGYGQDQGGGYLNTSTAGQFGASQGGGGGERKKQRAMNIMPCTIAQILATQQVDDKFVVDDIELHQVTLVGLIRSVKESPTRIEYQIDDMTGPPLDVRQFVDNDENTPEEERITAMRENMYARVHGHVRSFQNKHSVVAFKLLPIDDMNELTTHMLEVVHSHLALTRGHLGGGQMAGNTSYAGATSGNTSMSTGGYQGARPDQGLTPIQAQVHDVIARCMDEQGVSVSHICQNVRGLPQHAIRDAIEFLSSEGHIYSTIDDEHFKSTESM